MPMFKMADNRVKQECKIPQRFMMNLQKLSARITRN